jgi:hypothetical protein
MDRFQDGNGPLTAPSGDPRADAVSGDDQLLGELPCSPALAPPRPCTSPPADTRGGALFLRRSFGAGPSGPVAGDPPPAAATYCIDAPCTPGLRHGDPMHAQK